MAEINKLYVVKGAIYGLKNSMDEIFFSHGKRIKVFENDIILLLNTDIHINGFYIIKFYSFECNKVLYGNFYKQQHLDAFIKSTLKLLK